MAKVDQLSVASQSSAGFPTAMITISHYFWCLRDDLRLVSCASDAELGRARFGHTLVLIW
jgi:hypothetical protein